VLDALLVKPPDGTTTGFNRLKQAPGPATPKTVRLWTDRLDRLGGLIDPDPLAGGHRSHQAAAVRRRGRGAGSGRPARIAQSGKRHTLPLVLAFNYPFWAICA